MLGSPAAKRLQVLKVGPELVNMTTIYFKDSDINGIVGCFSKVFSGVGKLSAATSLTLHINREVLFYNKSTETEVDPLPFERDKVQSKIGELLNLDINKKVFRPNKQGQASCDSF